MTDPRIAALAEALRNQMPWRYDFAEDDELGPTNATFDAAAILAALPDDWCGHAERMTLDIARLVGELAYLRKIEEAARAQHGPVCGCCGGAWDDGHLGEWKDYIRCRCYRAGCNLGAALVDPDALRAALEAE